MRLKIDCIEKEDRYDPTEAIVSVGGRNPDGTRWRLSQKDAISGIKTGKYSFYVVQGAVVVDVIVSVSRFGHEYIKTVADGAAPNNLLNLQSCYFAA